MSRTFIKTQDNSKYDISIYFENNKWLIIIGNIEYHQEKENFFVNTNDNSRHLINIKFDNYMWKILLDNEELIEFKQFK